MSDELIPKLTAEDVERLIPGAKVVGSPKNGGQKLFYPITINNQRYGSKFLLVNPACIRSEDEQVQMDIQEAIMARATREYETMKSCQSPYLVASGPVPLRTEKIGEDIILFFTEEFIQGKDIGELIKLGRCKDIAKGKQLAENIGKAIDILYSCNKIHRDIKPQNIMFNESTSNFVLLDMGLVFDFDDKSITRFGFVPGTCVYYSPEHTNFEKRREMDFRSDLFCLGIVLYEYLTGIHPFVTRRGSTTEEIVENIVNHVQEPAISVNPSIPEAFSLLIDRLLQKKPHLRYRKVSHFLEDVEKLELEANI
jgi:serine/threonine protein kinase